jgi:two-component system, LytTR family, sensor kinase
MNIEIQKNRNSTFWTLQIIGWLLFLLYNLLITHYELISVGTPKIFIWLILLYFFGFPLSLLLRCVYKRLDFLSKSLFFTFLTILCGTIITAHIWLGFNKIFDRIISSESAIIFVWSFQNYISTTFNWFVVLVAWSSLYFFIKFWIEWNLQKERMIKADQLAQSAQMKMLRYQLNPHFLFNSLNSIRALIDQDEKTAKILINELTGFLQYSLEGKLYANVPFKREIEAVKHYLAIEKIRFEEKLDVEFDVDPKSAEFLVISFMINPLVENALKYGMKTSKIPLKIKVGSLVKDNSLKVEIVNSGGWVKPSETGERHRIKIGSGLDNVRQRLENVYPEKHRFSIFRRDDGIHVEIEINSSQKIYN